MPVAWPMKHFDSMVARPAGATARLRAGDQRESAPGTLFVQRNELTDHHNVFTL
jgi:hypothetical protein